MLNRTLVYGQALRLNYCNNEKEPESNNALINHLLSLDNYTRTDLTMCMFWATTDQCDAPTHQIWKVKICDSYLEISYLQGFQSLTSHDLWPTKTATEFMLLIISNPHTMKENYQFPRMKQAFHILQDGTCR